MEKKEFCLNRLDALIKLMNEAKTYDSKLYFSVKAEAFVEGLFYADVVNASEYGMYSIMINDMLIGK